MNPEPLVAQALAALKNEDFAAARDSMAEYGRTNPLKHQHYLIRGLAELALEDWNAARATFGKGVANFPDDAQLHFNLGIAQENLNDLKGAAASYERSLTLKDDPDTCGNLSNIYCLLARFAEAEAMARRALALSAPNAQALNSLGLALNRQNKFAEAQQAFEQAHQLEPDDFFVQSNLANLAVDQLDFTSAWKYFAAARAAGNDDPLIRHHEGMARLLAGDYATGWPLYEARLEIPEALRITPSCPRWNGEPLVGKKLLIVGEQGFGDVIQFCRYGVVAEKTGAKLLWAVPKNLLRLLEANLPGQVFPEGYAPQADYYVAIMSLPLALGLLDPAEAPEAPYLKIPPDLSPKPTIPTEQAIVGLVWTGSATHIRDFERSVPLEMLEPVMKADWTGYYAPFVGAGLEQIGQRHVGRLDGLIKDFADTACLIKQMHYIITVDTAVAHLAGAMGERTYLLLPYCPDWRWGTKGSKTPWYPSVTILRQPKPGDWPSVIAELASLLEMPKP